MENHLKLGKLPAVIDRRTIKFKSLIRRDLLPPLPASFDLDDHLGGIEDNNMYANDRYGNCVIAARAHQTLRFEKYEQGEIIPITDQEVIDQYFKESGGLDSGLYLLNSLKRWRKEGWTAAGRQHNIYAFASVDWKNHDEVKYCIYLLGGINYGFMVPQSCLDQFEMKLPWTVVTPDGGIKGGHGVYAFSYLNGYNALGPVIMTWGRRQQMTWDFWDKYCVAPETKILTGDLQWVRADSVKQGDILLAFDEHRAGNRGQNGGMCRYWRPSIVNSIDFITRPCYELEFEDGTQVICSSEHLWLTNHHQGSRWLKTESLRCCGSHLASNIVKPVDIWTKENSFEAGYLSAAFDGEGCLTQNNLTSNTRGMGVADVRLTFHQKPNIMLATIMKLLKERNFTFSEGHRDSGTTINIGIRKDILRFLGIFRPKRLLSKFKPEMLGQMSMKTVKLTKKKYAGEKVVVAIKTSTGTYIAEGLASHNCDEAYAIIDDKNYWQGDSPLDVEKLECYLKEICGEEDIIDEEPSSCPIAKAYVGLGNLIAKVANSRTRIKAPVRKKQ
ncbi:MAG: hypothetical protein PHW65_01590 [Dehalococcoidales bacterium]|nr:hypothetical protein [Dehalococcoidales bacterium]